MKLIRQLDNGQTVQRDDWNRLWLYGADGILVGQIERGTMAAQLLALTPEEFGDTPPPGSTSTVSVAGPVDPPRRNQTLWERYKAKLAAWRSR